MQITNQHVALNGTLSTPYTASFTILIADQSVHRTLHLTEEGARSFAKRHNVPFPEVSEAINR